MPKCKRKPQRRENALHKVIVDVRAKPVFSFGHGYRNDDAEEIAKLSAKEPVRAELNVVKQKRRYVDPRTGRISYR